MISKICLENKTYFPNNINHFIQKQDRSYQGEALNVPTAF